MPRRATQARRGGRLRRRVVLAVLASLLVSGAFIWLRDSSLVAVDRVQVRGVEGPQAASIRRSIEAAGRDMTTLHARPELVERALAAYPTVRSVQVETSFPRTLQVAVVMHEAVAVAETPRGPVAVAEDGTLMPGAGRAGLPQLRTRPSAVGTARVAGASAREGLDALAAVPAPDRRQVAVAWSGPRGIVIELKTGPRLYLGAPTRLEQKWGVAARLLRDPVPRAAAYIDVRLPERPAVGGAGDPQAAPEPGTPTAP